MLSGMSTPFSDDLDDKVIDITPFKPKRHRKLIILIVAAIVIIVALFRSVSIYISAIWFGSLGYSPVYWYIFRMKLFVFLIFAVLTIVILRAAFWLLERTFSASTLERRHDPLTVVPEEPSAARAFHPPRPEGELSLFGGNATRRSE